jgi:hypothetical protein
MTRHPSPSSEAERDVAVTVARHPYRAAPRATEPLSAAVGEVTIRSWVDLPLLLLVAALMLVAVLSLFEAESRMVAVLLFVVLLIRLAAGPPAFERGSASADPGNVDQRARRLRLGSIGVAREGWLVRWGHSRRVRVEPLHLPPQLVVRSRWCLLDQPDLERLAAMRFAVQRIGRERLSHGGVTERWVAIVRDVSKGASALRRPTTPQSLAYVAILTDHEMLLIADGPDAWRAALGTVDAPIRAEAKVLVDALRVLAPSELVARLRRCTQSGASFALPRDVACARLSPAGAGWTLDLDGVPHSTNTRRLALRPAVEERGNFDRWRTERHTS